ncbi:hypothetical protein U1Q18_004369 [Sarracenia purpurea var. burkii]
MYNEVCLGWASLVREAWGVAWGGLTWVVAEGGASIGVGLLVFGCGCRVFGWGAWLGYGWSGWVGLAGVAWGVDLEFFWGWFGVLVGVWLELMLWGSGGCVGV